MDLVSNGPAIALLITAVAGVLGLLFKRGIDKQNSRDERQTKANELEAKKAQEYYDQMQEDLTAARGEVRSVQDDLAKARTEMGTMWSQMAAMRRELEASEAHIADWHRWADNGAQGPRPVRKLTRP